MSVDILPKRSNNWNAPNLTPNMLDNIIDYLHANKRVNISEIEKSLSLENHIVWEAIYLLEDPKFYGIEAEPAIKRESELIELTGKDSVVDNILKAYNSKVFPNTKTGYVHLP